MMSPVAPSQAAPSAGTLRRRAPGAPARRTLDASRRPQVARIDDVRLAPFQAVGGLLRRNRTACGRGRTDLRGGRCPAVAGMAAAASRWAEE